MPAGVSLKHITRNIATRNIIMAREITYMLSIKAVQNARVIKYSYM